MILVSKIVAIIIKKKSNIEWVLRAYIYIYIKWMTVIDCTQSTICGSTTECRCCSCVDKWESPCLLIP